MPAAVEQIMLAFPGVCFSMGQGWLRLQGFSLPCQDNIRLSSSMSASVAASWRSHSSLRPVAGGRLG